MRAPLYLCAAAGLTACATASPPARTAAPRAAPAFALRSPAECAGRVLDSAAAPALYLPPSPDSIAIPPLPAPAADRGLHIVRFLVDTLGRANIDSLRIDPPFGAPYDARFRSRMTRYHFLAASVDRCPVMAWYTIRFTL